MQDMKHTICCRMNLFRLHITCAFTEIKKNEKRDNTTKDVYDWNIKKDFRKISLRIHRLFSSFYLLIDYKLCLRERLFLFDSVIGFS